MFLNVPACGDLHVISRVQLHAGTVTRFFCRAGTCRQVGSDHMLRGYLNPEKVTETKRSSTQISAVPPPVGEEPIACLRDGGVRIRIVMIASGSG